MKTDDWPHEQIRSVALRYIRKHAMNEPEWRFTVLDALAQRLARMVQLSAAERPVVTCATVSKDLNNLRNCEAFHIQHDSNLQHGALPRESEHRAQCSRVERRPENGISNASLVPISARPRACTAHGNRL